jgi:hypothetical protein
MWRISCGPFIVPGTALTSGGTKFFFLLLNMTMVNMCIIYLAECKRLSKPPVIHLQFKVELYAILQQWRSTRNPGSSRQKGYFYQVVVALE